jgi:hypothetical protein
MRIPNTELVFALFFEKTHNIMLLTVICKRISIDAVDETDTDLSEAVADLG